jgi:TPR repeat protein
MRGALASLVCAVVGASCSSHNTKPPDADDAGISVEPADRAATLDKKCAAGDLESCRQLGVMYQDGTGVSVDSRRATQLFNQACTGNNVSACNNLALNLSEGIGVDRNAARAIDVYQKSCDGGFSLACRNLGLMLRDGHGGATPDLVRAALLLDKACKANVTFACKNAGDLDAMVAMKNTPARWKQALAHYKRGCDAGDSTACRQIGMLYLDGKGLTKSTNAATVWLERACVGDDAFACRVFGAMLVEGIGVAKPDVDRGKHFLQRACDAKDDEGCRLLMKVDAATGSGSSGWGSASIGSAGYPDEGQSHPM